MIRGRVQPVSHFALRNTLKQQPKDHFAQIYGKTLHLNTEKLSQNKLDLKLRQMKGRSIFEKPNANQKQTKHF